MSEREYLIGKALPSELKELSRLKSPLFNATVRQRRLMRNPEVATRLQAQNIGQQGFRAAHATAANMAVGDTLHAQRYTRKLGRFRSGKELTPLERAHNNTERRRDQLTNIARRKAEAGGLP